MEVLKKMGKFTGVTSECGIPIKRHIPIQKQPPMTAQIVIGTPGTINKWVTARKLSMNSVKILVFDEADHMLAESGFKDDSVRIMKAIVRSSSNCQGNKVGQTIIFVRMKISAEELHTFLKEYGYGVTVIQENYTQEERDKIVKEFKDGLTQVLISIDLLARGFDQSDVNLVVNFDLPAKHKSPTEPDCEVYLHRVGRAGRFGRNGAVFNLISDQTDEMVMAKIERLFSMQVDEVPSSNSDVDFKAALKDAKLL